MDQRLADEENTKPVTSAKEWANYQRQVTGDREVKLGKGDAVIWADGLHVDPDTVVVAEAKYVDSPTRSMYEGKVPPALLERLLSPFDREMQRYGKLVEDLDNPVSRVRIITNTKEAADFLGARARRVLGPTIDVDVRHTSPKEQP